MDIVNGQLHVVGMLKGMTTTIINGACGIGINAGHRTSNQHADNIRFQGPEVLYTYEHARTMYVRVHVCIV